MFALPMKVRVPTAPVPACPVIFTFTLAESLTANAENGASENALIPNIINYEIFF